MNATSLGSVPTTADSFAAVRGISFDLGGTVVQLTGGVPTTGQVAAILEISLVEVRSWMETGPKRSRTTCVDLAARLALEFDRPDVEDRLAAVLEAARWAATHSVLYDDAVPALGELRRRGYRLFALSNAVGSSACDPDPAYYKHFDEVFASYDTGVCKPETAAFTLVERAADLQPHQLLHIGDSPRVDVHGALNAGWLGIHLDRLPASDEPATTSEAPSSLRIHTLSALLHLLPATVHPEHSGSEVASWI